jgi:preprotein translocase subunit SecY
MRSHDLKPRPGSKHSRKGLSVMLIIFAGVVLLFPQKILLMLGRIWNIKLVDNAAQALNESSALCLSIYALIVLAFFYFWVTTQFANPKSGGPEGS